MRVSQVADDFKSANPDHCYASYANKVKDFVETARVCDLDKKWTKAFCERMRERNGSDRLRDGQPNHCIKITCDCQQRPGQ